MKTLACTLEEKLGKDTDNLFQHSEQKHHLSNLQVTTAIGIKLDGLSKVLGLHPFDQHGQPLSKLKPISEKNIEPVHLICPQSMQCVTQHCNSCSLVQETRDHDVPHVLSGQCPECDIRYYADHENSQATPEMNSRVRLYLESAKYIKIGQDLCVDHVFSGTIVNGSYSFHASSVALAEF
jgi:hypothetical protein